MAKCPACGAKQSYWGQVSLSLYSRRKIVCGNCGVSLRINQKRMIFFHLFFYSAAGVFGLTMVHTGLYLRWMVILVMWIVLLMILYPFFVRLSTSEKME